MTHLPPAAWRILRRRTAVNPFPVRPPYVGSHNEHCLEEDQCYCLRSAHGTAAGHGANLRRSTSLGVGGGGGNGGVAPGHSVTGVKMYVIQTLASNKAKQ